jgi:hypothetical protein
MRRLLAGLLFGLLTLYSANDVTAGLMDAEPRPLTVPTPSQPKLRLPEVQAPPPSLMLEKRPLQIRPSQGRPTLNVLPQTDPDVSPSDDLEEPMPADVGERRRPLHLQHGH